MNLSGSTRRRISQRFELRFGQRLVQRDRNPVEEKFSLGWQRCDGESLCTVCVCAGIEPKFGLPQPRLHPWGAGVAVGASLTGSRSSVAVELEVSEPSDAV